VIFEVLGTPNETDIAFVTDSKAINYLKSFSPVDRCDLAKKYPGAVKEAIDLLNKMLQINPFFRVSVDDALAHPVFAKIRKESRELSAQQLVLIDFED
jgi:serine/threonine protein kinase